MRHIQCAIKYELTSSDVTSAVCAQVCLWHFSHILAFNYVSLLACSAHSTQNYWKSIGVRKRISRENNLRGGQRRRVKWMASDLPRCVTHSAPEVLLLSCQYHHQFRIYRRKIHSVWLFHRCYRSAIDFSAMTFYRISLVAFAAPTVQSQALNTAAHQLLPIWTNTGRTSLGFLQNSKSKTLKEREKNIWLKYQSCCFLALHFRQKSIMCHFALKRKWRHRNLKRWTRLL